MKILRVLLLCIAASGLMFSFAYAVDEAAMVKASIANGAKLYVDPSLGTSGKTCNTCHMEMGKSKKEGMMGAKGFIGRKPFPKYSPMPKRVMTLEQMIQFCIVTPLDGKALAWDDQKLTDLTSYVNSIYTGKK
ncbi:MAG: hypothetical protein HY756_09285 [Nitrospirae bacterium]|nr:hypothetical protein [Nitrospirota bacterium]